MSGTPTIPCNFTLLVGPDGTQPISFDFDTIDVNSTIKVPDPIVTNSSSNSDADIDLKVEPLTVTSDSKSEITSDSKSEIDLKPVAVDSCQTIKLAPLPPSHTEQPYSQHFGFTFMGVELFGFSTSGRYETFLNNPSPPAPRGIRHEHSGRLGRPSVIGRPHGISVRVVDSDE
jgi:hypothetical protein